ncbi:peptidyl-tRNA hydrolase [Pseudoneurospora amorphoporcata]|uniref:peptidyl-tRNA hydrolase n=1 Tax=Pseudoneurospora amorphoporcata TaxID=241081 RepID=A0AAN6NQR1_9PEZI|nr:peptidyl-tRNA hydrolase [Pseudoneurospora amorphoporcata]
MAQENPVRQQPSDSASKKETANPETHDGNMASLRRFLVVSLGNPGEYRDTYHSAGHMVLESFQKKLPEALGQPSFASERYGKKAVRASAGAKYTLLQSPTLMNITGPWLARAYKDFMVDQGLSPEEVGLVLVHDDLEEELGVVKVRQWKASHRGHNGIKSVLASLPPMPDAKWARVSIGIGRPDDRDRTTVSDFVLSKVPGQAKGILQDKGGSGLWEALSKLETKWNK